MTESVVSKRQLDDKACDPEPTRKQPKFSNKFIALYHSTPAELQVHAQAALAMLTSFKGGPSDILRGLQFETRLKQITLVLVAICGSDQLRREYLDSMQTEAEKTAFKFVVFHLASVFKEPPDAKQHRHNPLLEMVELTRNDKGELQFAGPYIPLAVVHAYLVFLRLQCRCNCTACVPIKV